MEELKNQQESIKPPVKGDRGGLKNKKINFYNWINYFII